MLCFAIIQLPPGDFLTSRNLFQCRIKHPKRQFSIKVGTIFEDSPIGLDKWLPALWMLANCENGISSYEVARGLGVTQKTAWFMLHRVLEAMKREPLVGMLAGVVADGGGTVLIDLDGVGVLTSGYGSVRWRPTTRWIVEPGLRLAPFL